MEHWYNVLIGHNPYRLWLYGRGSLTAAIKRHCPGLQVNRIRQTLAKPHADELRPLSLKPREQALVREVLLSCEAHRLVFAHSVIPRTGLTGPWHCLSRLGNRPLGETLFADPRIVRHGLQFRRLDARHPLYCSAARLLDKPPRYLWARRSIFVRDGQPLLVSEVFLPDILRLTQG